MLSVTLSTIKQQKMCEFGEIDSDRRSRVKCMGSWLPSAYGSMRQEMEGRLEDFRAQSPLKSPSIAEAELLL